MDRRLDAERDQQKRDVERECRRQLLLAHELAELLGGGWRAGEAIAAAADGDLILVKEGIYSESTTPITLDGKSLSLVAEPGANVIWYEVELDIVNLAADQTVMMRGLRTSVSTLDIADSSGSDSRTRTTW